MNRHLIDMLDRFSLMMYRELKANDEKKGDSYKEQTERQKFQEIIKHLDKLAVAAKKQDMHKIAEHCVDVANCCMIYADHHQMVVPNYEPVTQNGPYTDGY